MQDTSLEAWDKVKDIQNVHARDIYKLLARVGSKGYTDEQLIGITKLQQSTERGSRGLLCKAGLVIDSNKRRKSRNDCYMIVWVINKPGYRSPERIRE